MRRCPLLPLVVWVLSYGSCTFSACAQKIPAIIDTDIGTFIDDSFALALALQMPEFDIQLIVTASHDTVGRARVAAKHLTLVGADHIPLGIGVATDNQTGPLFSWAADFDLSGYAGGVHKDGVKAMQEAIDACNGTPVALIEIGPHTNVRALLDRFPHVQQKVRVTVMGGSVVPGIRLPWGPVTPVNTTNEKEDPLSAQALVHAQWAEPPRFAPVETTIQVAIKGALWQELQQSKNLAVQVLLECYMHWWNESRTGSWITTGEANSLDPTRESAILWDAEAVHLAATTQWLTLTELNVDFDNWGHTVVSPDNSSSGRRAWFALNWTDQGLGPNLDGGRDSFLQHMTSLLLASQSWSPAEFGSAPTPSEEVVHV
ncbi:unnamed protein product [Polarella glacialis]|uniref:Inosine/uridine-preferring nucleoside hydrolase domain-containing protein n=1 Tax=Polarella glacialis TaxID=89957 RepID=A0A813J879_POLGL|nr:unnamed protein product [Polarella glacialis]